MNAFNTANLPVAPEFVSMLQEQVVENLINCLKKLNVPQEVIALVTDLDNLGYYRAMCSENPACLTGDFPTFDGMDVTIDAINHIAACGGVFTGAYSESIPREGTLLAPGLNKADEAKYSRPYDELTEQERFDMLLIMLELVEKRKAQKGE